MTSTDKDFRFMATNDLMTELQKDSIKLDDESERKVTLAGGGSAPGFDSSLLCCVADPGCYLGSVFFHPGSATVN
jgi:hypothetical protein